MKAYIKGMTEAVTRDGREVTQLHEYDLLGIKRIYGVIGGEVQWWHIDGSVNARMQEPEDDLFAPVEYEWQWIIKYKSTHTFDTSGYHTSREVCEKIFKYTRAEVEIFSRIKESKREVQS